MIQQFINYGLILQDGSWFYLQNCYTFTSANCTLLNFDTEEKRLQYINTNKLTVYETTFYPN